MTRDDEKQKMPGGDKNLAPPPDDPNDLDEPSGGDYTVVNLALWAGDYQTASEILRDYSYLRGRSVSISPFENPVLASLQHLQGQLQRKRNEYARFAESANLAANLRGAQAPLRSIGGHLQAIIWAESDRDYELRLYLRKLDWETDFYINAFRLADAAGVPVTAAHVRQLGYGFERAPQPDEQEPQVDPTTELAWTTTTAEMFLQSHISDFCTGIVRGIWIAAQLPDDAGSVLRVFQKFLDSFDPTNPAP